MFRIAGFDEDALLKHMMVGILCVYKEAIPEKLNNISHICSIFTISKPSLIKVTF